MQKLNQNWLAAVVLLLLLYLLLARLYAAGLLGVIGVSVVCLLLPMGLVAATLRHLRKRGVPHDGR